jgi:CheY-like chemotaxis protein
MGAPATILALTTDLWFLSRIRSAAGTLATIEAVRRAGDLLDRARATGPALVLVDMNAAGQDWADTVRRLKSEPATATINVIAFGPHVDRESQALARSAGADRVLSNQRFVETLPQLLAQALADQ